MGVGNPIYTPGTTPQHTALTAGVVIHLAVDYLHACNEYDAGNGTQEEAVDCLRQLQQYIQDALEGDEEVDKV